MQEPQIRTREQWLEELKASLPKLKEIIVTHLGLPPYNYLEAQAAAGNTVKALDMLNQIWVAMPDSFNIMNEAAMNSGWRELLSLVEFWDEAEAKNVLAAPAEPDYKGFGEHLAEWEEKGVPYGTKDLVKLARKYGTPLPGEEGIK